MFRRQFLANTMATSGVMVGHAGLGLGMGAEFELELDRLTTNVGAATVHPLATQSASEAMRAGGNAIDAAIAAALVLGVVDGHNSGIGGGCLILARLSNGAIVAVDGRETAGAAAYDTMFVRDGVADASLSQTGPLACGVPGQIAAMKRLHADHGRLAWNQLFDWAIGAAENGCPVSAATARTLAAEATDLARFAASKEIFLDRDGKPPREGEQLVQKDLAKTLRSIAEQGAEWFYTGPFAASCAEYLQSIGGILTQEDFVRYRAIDRSPITTVYRGMSILGFPPPSSGGIHIAQMLQMMQPYPVREWYESSPIRFYHLLAECMKRAFADRAFWLGDSDFVSVPSGLLDPQYALDRMKDFDPSRATLGIERGYPPRSDAERRIVDPAQPNGKDGKHTTHLTTADREGNWVAMTCTVNTSWGSKVTVPGTGVILNNEMDDFAIAPGTPNAFGLVGSQANAVAAGKRPLSSMSPTLVLDAMGLPVITCGAAGGPRIINATLQTLVRTIDCGQSIEDAIAAPRVHQQWRPDQLLIESEIGKGTSYEITEPIREGLKSLGHTVKSSSGLAVAQGIQRRGDRLLAAHDPRAKGTSED
jgi:gamma-glutamyltranspeptidase / glutathione hydrolase